MASIRLTIHKSHWFGCDSNDKATLLKWNIERRVKGDRGKRQRDRRWRSSERNETKCIQTHTQWNAISSEKNYVYEKENNHTVVGFESFGILVFCFAIIFLSPLRSVLFCSVLLFLVRHIVNKVVPPKNIWTTTKNICEQSKARRRRRRRRKQQHQPEESI